MSHRQSLIITGMHRSHTSLVAEAFHDAGLYLGDDLIGALDSNPHGHFESRQVVDFHRDIIKENQIQDWWTHIDNSKAQKYAKTRTFKEKAAQLLGEYFTRDLIGWKDPRTAFFLEGWHEVLPDPHYIFVIRHPSSCVQSLNRRSMAHSNIKHRPFLSTRHFNLWDATNLCILEFNQSHPERCVIIDAPHDLLDIKRIANINDVVMKKWKLPMDVLNFKKVLDPNLIKSGNHKGFPKWLYDRRTKTNELYESLIERTIK